MRKFELGALPADRGHPIVASSFREEGPRSRKLTPATGTDTGKLFRTKKFFLDGFYHEFDFEGLRLRKSIEIHTGGNSRFDFYVILNPSSYHFNHGSMIRIDFLLKLKNPLTGCILIHFFIHNPEPPRRKPGQQNHGGIACRELRRIREMPYELVRPAGFLMMIRMTLKLEKNHVGEETAVIPGMIWVGWFKGSVFPLGSSQSVMLDVIHGFQKKDCHKGLSDKEDQPAHSEKPQHHHSHQ